MFIVNSTPALELERSGREYGRELAAALVLASSRVGNHPELKREMSQIVVREILKSAADMRTASVAEPLVRAYELACRAGVRCELQDRVASRAARRAA